MASSFANRRSPHLRVLTWCGAVLGCSVLITPWLGLQGLSFHLVYGFLYTVYSAVFTVAIWQANRAGCSSRLVARFGHRPVLVCFTLLTLVMLGYWLLAVYQWQSGGDFTLY